MRKLVATCVVLTFLFVGAQADAAMALRMTVDPRVPTVGSTAHVAVLTLAPFSHGCVNDPAADMRPWWDWNGDGGRDLAFDLRAFQDDRVITIPLTRRASDLAYWDGSVVFPTPGRWTVRMVKPEWSGGVPDGEECAGARITVLVRDADRLPGTSTDGGNGASLLLAWVVTLTAAFLLWAGRRLQLALELPDRRHPYVGPRQTRPDDLRSW
jgi:hypothetical protein